MALSHEEFKRYRVTKRPYPFDFERKQRVERVMYENGIKTISELAGKLKINYTVLTEKRVAAFFKMPVEELFPPRTQDEIAQMNKRKKERNKGAA